MIDTSKIYQSEGEFLNSLTKEASKRFAHHLITFEGTLGYALEDRFIIFAEGALKQAVRRNNEDDKATKTQDTSFQIVWMASERTLISSEEFIGGTTNGGDNEWKSRFDNLTGIFGDKITDFGGLTARLWGQEGARMTERWNIRFEDNAYTIEIMN